MPDDARPTHLPERYALLARLGAGGMGVVYQARDRMLNRIVAIKWVAAGHREDAKRNARLLYEARAAAAIAHPGAIAIFDAGEAADASVFVVMEYAPGGTLRDRMKRSPPPSLRTRLDWLAQIASVLAAAHARGIVHGDVKPENVIVRDDGVVKVVDFGIARALQRAIDAHGDTSPAWLHDDAHHARGAGTPGYVAPEQQRGLAVDGRADQFAWGIVAYELLTGRSPWPEDTLTGPVREVEGTHAPSIRAFAPEVSDAIDAVVMRAIARDREARFESMDALYTELGAAGISSDTVRSIENASSPKGAIGVSASPIAMRRPGVRGAAIAIAIVGAAVGAATLHGASSRPEVASAPRAPRESSSSAEVASDASQPSSNLEARAAYAAGMQAVHDATREAALARFSEATELDPTFAAAHLRLVATARAVDDDVREHARRALAERARLGAHDRVLLEAYLAWTGVPQDVRASERILEEALEAHTGDADFAFHLCRVRTFLGKFAKAEEACARAVRIDPTFADALHFQGFSLLSLDDVPAARIVYDQCLAVSPAATSCLRELAELELATRHCDEIVRIARRLIALDPGTAIWFRLLAFGLFGTGDSIESVRGAFEQSWARRSPTKRPIYEAAERAQIAIAIGDFAEAEKQLRRYETAVADSTDALVHLEPADWLVELYIEQGRFAEATRVADSYDRRRAAWGQSALGDTAIYVARWRYHSNALSRAGFVRARNAWLAAEKAHPTADGQNGTIAGLSWTFAYAVPANSAEDAAEALAALPDYLPLTATFLRDQEDGAIGRTYRLGGKIEEALGYLRGASSACGALVSPFNAPRATYQLALALEQNGQIHEACDAYENVSRRWPASTTHARSTLAASVASARLRCGDDVSR